MADEMPPRPLPPGESDPALGLPQFEPTTAPAPTEQSLRRGLRHLHAWSSRTREDAWSALLEVQALLHLLLAKGIVTREEVDEFRQLLTPAVQERFAADPLAPYISETPDKYVVTSPEIDCEALIPICKARCCRLRFALSIQDLDEGMVRWDYGKPYLIAHRADGYCTHCQPATGACGVYHQRPAPCRRYDCRDDKRIWADFEARIPAPWGEIEAEEARVEASARRLAEL